MLESTKAAENPVKCPSVNKDEGTSKNTAAFNA